MAFLRVIQIVSRYGSRVVNWCWANRSTILWWIAGGGVDYAVAKIKQVFGL